MLVKGCVFRLGVPILGTEDAVAMAPAPAVMTITPAVVAMAPAVTGITPGAVAPAPAVTGMTLGVTPAVTGITPGATILVMDAAIPGTIIQAITTIVVISDIASPVVRTLTAGNRS